MGARPCGPFRSARAARVRHPPSPALPPAHRRMGFPCRREGSPLPARPLPMRTRSRPFSPAPQVFAPQVFMSDIIGLALPFFGLIFLGYGCGRFVRLPEEGLAWLTFFIIYLALPALFYRIVSQTPFAELVNPRFILAVVISTSLCAFLALGLALWLRRGQCGGGGHCRHGRGLCQCGLYGPGPDAGGAGPGGGHPRRPHLRLRQPVLFHARAAAHGGAEAGRAYRRHLGSGGAPGAHPSLQCGDALGHRLRRLRVPRARRGGADAGLPEECRRPPVPCSPWA